MTAKGKRTGVIWVILADVLGVGLLISLLASAGGAPALKDYMTVLVMLLPVAAGLMLLSTRMIKPAAKPAVAPGPVRERKVVIAPRPVDLRAA